MTPTATIDPRSSLTSSGGRPRTQRDLRQERTALRASSFTIWQKITTARELYALPVGSVVANGIPGPLFWTRAHGNGGRWHESTPTGEQLPADGVLVPADGLQSSLIALPAVVVRVGDGIVS